MTTCDLRLGSVNVTNNQLSCNNSTLDDDFALSLSITGTGVNPIDISSSDVTVFFKEVDATSSVRLSRSSATLIFEGANELAQIVCTDESNVSMAAIGPSSIAVKAAGGSGAGIGTPENGRCSSLYIRNGSVNAQGDPTRQELAPGSRETGNRRSGTW
jgi:hypothetical protein